MLLRGVNMYLEWLITYHDTAKDDVRNMRRELPAANLVRFVALLWHDSVKESDGLECSTDDAANGYLSAACVAAMDGLNSSGHVADHRGEKVAEGPSESA